MPNVLITNKCNQSCSYCFAQEKMKEETKEMSFVNFKKVLDFLENSSDKKLRLLGGEPTMHSKFKEIVELAIARGFSVQIFTNGIFSEDTLNFLASKENKIIYSFNVNPKEEYLDKNYNQVLNNLEKLSVFKNILLGTVVQNDNFNADYLLEIAKKYQIKRIALRVSNPVSLVNKNTLIKEIDKIKKEKIGFGFGCGLSEKFGVAGVSCGCGENSGKFDIGVDLSVFRCFPLAGWKTKKLSDFRNTEEVKKYFSYTMKKYQSINTKKDFINKGPCFANLLK